jgi:hypothetical protein
VRVCIVKTRQTDDSINSGWEKKVGINGREKENEKEEKEKAKNGNIIGKICNCPIPSKTYCSIINRVNSKLVLLFFFFNITHSHSASLVLTYLFLLIEIKKILNSISESTCRIFYRLSLLLFFIIWSIHEIWQKQ